MNTAVVQAKEPAQLAPAPETPALRSEVLASPATNGLCMAKLVSLPVVTLIALAVHIAVSKNEPPIDTRSYTVFLGIVLGLSMVAAIVQPAWAGMRRWMAHMWPILSVFVSLLCAWEVITSGFRLLPLPYFPSPATVLQNLINDWKVLAKSTWYSLLLLGSGYVLGVMVALVTGVCMGWFRHVRYWGMPLLKIIGPVPATAWVPLAMILSPSKTYSAVGLIALAVWFPVTMLTMSGIANTRASYLDVARTLGANQKYLILKVAIPAALPNIFLGLFMGLGTSFLTLIVAETVGVESGLGWYINWAQGWAEYGKVYAALVIMAVFFSTIMTLLFKVRDRMLVWQKGVIKW